MMNIKRIIREELEDGFKDSNEEDWGWIEGNIDLKHILDIILEGSNFLILTADEEADFWGYDVTPGYQNLIFLYEKDEMSEGKYVTFKRTHTLEEVIEWIYNHINNSGRPQVVIDEFILLYDVIKNRAEKLFNIHAKPLYGENIREELDGFKDSNEEDWGWIDNKLDLSKTIFYSDNSGGIYDQWTVGYDIYKLLLNNGVIWENGMKLNGSDDTKFYDRYYIRVTENNLLLKGPANQKLTTDFINERGFNEYTIINVDDKPLYGENIREELEDGLKDSNEEDWEWTKGVNSDLPNVPKELDIMLRYGGDEYSEFSNRIIVNFEDEDLDGNWYCYDEGFYSKPEWEDMTYTKDKEEQERIIFDQDVIPNTENSKICKTWKKWLIGVGFKVKEVYLGDR